MTERDAVVRMLPTHLGAANTIKTQQIIAPENDIANSTSDTSAAVHEVSRTLSDVTENKAEIIDQTSSAANIASPSDGFNVAKNVSQGDGFQAALLRYVSHGTRVIVLSAADSGYADMALNLYKTSYERFGITNHLFLGTDAQLCSMLNASGAHCVQYSHLLDESADYEASNYHTKEFKIIHQNYWEIIHQTQGYTRGSGTEYFRIDGGYRYCVLQESPATDEMR